jgi:phage tail sheath protein FI
MSEPFLHGVQVIIGDGGTRPIQVAPTSVIGIVGTAPRADADMFPLNTPVLIPASRAMAAKLLANSATSAGDGTLPDAIDSIFNQAGAWIVVVRVDVGVDDAATLANVLGGTDAGTGQYEGVHAFLAAQSVTFVKPRILIVPGFTHQRPAGEANAVVAELLPIAERLRAIIVKDCESTNDTAALAGASDTGSRRVYVIDPRALKKNAAGVTAPAWSSAVVAGAIARNDATRGWWSSPSNIELFGIVGTERAIDFASDDPNSRSNLLNAGKVATIIREEGFRLWGNLTTSSDAKWKFLPVVRTADIIADAIQRSHLWAVDRMITKTYVAEVRESVAAFLRDLKQAGAILGGECWVDPELNSESSIANGEVYWDFDFTPTYPAQKVTFRMHIVNKYIAEIF